MRRLAVAVMLVVLASIAGACRKPEPQAVAAPPASLPRASEFSGTADLLASIERGTFDERVGLTEQLAALKIPPPVDVAFVRGTRVPQEALGELRELAQRLRANPRLRVDLIGCSDPSGPEAVNLRISQARAESVASELETLGVAESQLGEVVGRGESCEVAERVVHVLPELWNGKPQPDADVI